MKNIIKRLRVLVQMLEMHCIDIEPSKLTYHILSGLVAALEYQTQHLIDPGASQKEIEEIINDG